MKPILFFDGECNLCNTSVDFMLRIDKHDRFLFAPLQGITARKYLSAHAAESLETFLLFHHGKLFDRSEALLQIAQILGGFWKLFLIFRFLPKRIRDRVYDFIANNRYRWFGRRKTCRVPTKKERAHFLD